MRVINWKKILLIIALALVVVYPFLDKNDYRLYLANRALIHSILVSGLVFLTGFAGQISLGQAGFYAIGAYTSAYITTRLGMPIILGIMCGILLSLVAGLILSIPSFKLKAFFLSLVTIAFGQIVYVLILNLQSITGGPYGLFGIPPMKVGQYYFDNKGYYYTFLIILVLVILIIYRIKNSYLGRSMFAINDDVIAAEVCGINSKQSKIFAFALSASLAGLAGSLYAHLAGFLSPEPFTFFESSNFVAMAVVGGLRNILGGTIGGVTLTFLPEFLRFRGWENYYLIVTSLIVVLVVVFMPNGLGNIIFKLFRGKTHSHVIHKETTTLRKEKEGGTK